MDSDGLGEENPSPLAAVGRRETDHFTLVGKESR